MAETPFIVHNVAPGRNRPHKSQNLALQTSGTNRQSFECGIVFKFLRHMQLLLIFQLFSSDIEVKALGQSDLKFRSPILNL